MDAIHDFIADSLGVDKTSLSVQLGLYYSLLSLGGVGFYFLFAGLSYYYWFVYNKPRTYPASGLTKDPAKLRAQIMDEIRIALTNIPLMAVLMLPLALGAHRGHSQLYKSVDDHGWAYLFFSIPLMFAFSDFCIYWIHRGLHHPLLYRRIHKPHHTYMYTTPFSSHAFHFVDGFLQGCPYYIFVYIFPFHRFLFLGMFLTVNFWTISIHDEVDFGPVLQLPGGRVGDYLINTTGHHTVHHVQFNYNYGQYFTIWDRLCGTYRAAEQTHDWVSGKRVMGRS